MTPALNPTIKAMLASLGADRAFVRGAGTRLFDDAGREYLDCWAQYGVLALGHNPPSVVAAMYSVTCSTQLALQVTLAGSCTVKVCGPLNAAVCGSIPSASTG